MRVLIIGSGDSPSTFIARQIQGLQQLGVEVLHLPDLGKHRFLSPLILNAGITFHLPQEVKWTVKQADLIHYQWPGHWLILHNLATRFKKPAVLSLRGRQINILPFIPRNKGYTRKLKRLLPECDAFHCVSQAILEETKALGLKEERAFVIRPAVDPSFFTPADFPPPMPPLKVIMIGALMWRKGYEYAIMGIKQAIVEGLDIELNIIGSGPDTERLNYMIQELNLNNRVHLLGEKTPIKVKELLQSSHILLHTSLSEGIANVILEAMSCELAVVTTAAGGISEVVKDGANGLLVSQRDPTAIASMLIKLHENPELQKELGKNARKCVLREHTLDQQANLFFMMYKSVLGKL